MGIFEAIKAGSKELMKPETHVKGDKFENYILNLFAPSDLWILLKRTQDYTNNNQMYETASLQPDFTLKHKASNKIINIECKYRSSLNPDGRLEWCKSHQFQRYKANDKFSNTFIIVGFKGEPNHPEKLFLFKLSDIKYDKLYPSVFNNYEIDVGCLFDMKDGKIVQMSKSTSSSIKLKHNLERFNKFLKGF